MKWTWRNPRTTQLARLMDRLALHQGRLAPTLRYTRYLWVPDVGQPHPERLAVQAIHPKKKAPAAVTAKAA